MLAGVFLTDQRSPDMGNLWVWPGSHKTIAAHLRDRGPDALLGMAHPSLALGQPHRVVGAAGDLLLAHYLLGHNMGGNLASSVRRVVFRIRPYSRSDGIARLDQKGKKKARQRRRASQAGRER
jgi:hypothetical protein